MNSQLDIIHYLSSKECNGRRVGTPGHTKAQRYIINQLEQLKKLSNGKLEIFTQNLQRDAGETYGQNIFGILPGKGRLKDRYLLIEAHYDHLGEDEDGFGYYPGADDNAASIAITLHAAAQYYNSASSDNQRALIVAFFDAEEPPYFKSGDMGAMQFCDSSPVPLEQIDLSIILDLLGHPVGGCPLLHESFFILGAEKSAIATHIDALSNTISSLKPFRIGIHTIPPLGNYLAFSHYQRPYLFFTSGRSKHYHSIFDSAEKIDYPKVSRLTDYFTKLLLSLSIIDTDYFQYDKDGQDDRATLETLYEILKCLGNSISNIDSIKEFVEQSLLYCQEHDNLNDFDHSKLAAILAKLEKYLS